MKTKISLLVVVLIVSSLFSACEMLNIKLRVNDEGVFDEIYTYEVPYDAAFLTVIEAVDAIPGWKLEMTYERQGHILARQDSLRGKLVTIWIRQVTLNQTSIELHHTSQNVQGADKLMREIDYFFVK